MKIMPNWLKNLGRKLLKVSSPDPASKPPMDKKDDTEAKLPNSDLENPMTKDGPKYYQNGC